MTPNPSVHIESFLSARLFMSPQRVGDRLYFISNLSGHMSLYAMDWGGSVPEPLIPPDISLQNPILMNGKSFYVYPALGRILVMIDHDGDENYQPMIVPVEGGYPESAFGDRFENARVHLLKAYADANMAYFNAESRLEAMNTAYRANLATGELTELGSSPWGAFVAGINKDHTKAIVADGYTMGDIVLYLWTEGSGERRLLYGKPLEARAEGEEVPLSGIFACHFTHDDRRLLCVTSMFQDNFGLGSLSLEQPDELVEVSLTGAAHEGAGELVELEHLHDDRYYVKYNIDGVSMAYEGTYDERALEMRLDAEVVGPPPLAQGVVQAHHYEEGADGYAVSFSTATSPAQLYTVDGGDRRTVEAHTRERVLGMRREWLSPGEDASYDSHDGLRVSARLYLPADGLGYSPPYPLAYYVHGGPQSQEKPDFTWFSMPLIQYLTMKGMAVFVPNVRGSSGYGLKYMKHVDRDWGGMDRLDHVHAMTEVLPKDERVDVSRAGVVGRSYGGYMTLMLAGRHPELWQAAVDMFGPYDLLTFMDRIPETWKPYFRLAIGDPETDHDHLVEMSPKTYLPQLQCPMLVIQGANDPRVVERESSDIVENLRAQGKSIDYLVFENEGHDVLKFENRVRCYNAITDFFVEHLVPQAVTV